MDLPTHSNVTKSALRESVSASSIEMKIEVVVLPVSDVERAKRFYADLGWRLDIDYAGKDNYRVIQFTPPGSGCSVIFGSNVTMAAPGSVKGLHLIVSDIEAACDDLRRRGIAVSEPFHDPGGIFHHASATHLAAGPNPQRKSYASYASFSDPDGNGWVFQEITARLTGHIEEGDDSFTPELTEVVRRAEAAARGGDGRAAA
ncbi:VOC family protein [Bradyrhizobium centrosematis]|uniref:VOC family protein n=1 Tax=Bradyrhizobium centrosematis TaxID=1300039 RepID=UPI00388E5213